ncbi:MAG: glycoside hydrolase/phage tail family protein [Pseudomonadota bacterium]
MAQIVLSEVGAAVGARFLPQGVSVLGQQIAGQVIGRAVGSVAGRALDTTLFSEDVAGPRLKSLHIMESREGAGIPSVYGRMRVGGQVIWAARFNENRRESGGGKGGPTVTEYQYSVSFAVGIAEGPVTRVDRVWANGEPLDLATVSARMYRGTEDQLPDPVIEAIEGAGSAPAFRGLCYIVFEDLPLAAYGNRLPQLSFEVVRVPPGSDTLAAHIDGVNIIPASGEFAYATDIIRTRQFPGIEVPQNANSGESQTDFVRSLEQLRDELPAVNGAALTVAWFVDDLRAGACQVRPGVETRDKVTRPWAWEAGGTDRASAALISTDGNGRSNYGGTPADWSVIQAIQAQKAEGIAVTVSPFLLMDVPPANGLPDPYGGTEQAPFPWRGRVTSTADGTAGARTDVDAFLGSAAVSDFSLDAQKVRYSGPSGDWGYRRFVLHLAWLAKAAGGVDGFLLGSELRGLSRLRDGTGAFPFVEGLIDLVNDVRAILGPDVTITYAADWTEYGAYAPGDGSNDVLFPLDPFWAHSEVDLVAIDWYPPTGDWRQGSDHLDAQAGFDGPGDPAYLQGQFEGGEAYDWFYASAGDRDEQVRTPIIDTAHGEHWLFRAKDLAGWWSASHHERPGGVRSAMPTAWVPGSKPIRLAEIGFPAVDLGPNSPNLFYDPKSSESALPPYSNGERDDILQRRALVAALEHYKAQPFIEKAFVWCWDARPFPAFPQRSDVWGDGENWSFGHWLNGRTGVAPLADVVSDLLDRGAVEAFDADRLDGLVEGYVVDGVTTVRRALEPLRAAYDFSVLEDGGELRATPRRASNAVVQLSGAELVTPGVEWTDRLLDAASTRTTLSFADPANGYQPASVEARIGGKDPRNVTGLSLPLAFSVPEAQRLAERLLEAAQPMRTGSVSVPFTRQDLEVGTWLEFEDSDDRWQVSAVSDGLERRLTLITADTAEPVQRAVTPPASRRDSPVTAAPELLIIDGPRLPGEGDTAQPLIAVAARPWPGSVEVAAGPSVDSQTIRAIVPAPALMGFLISPLSPGPLGRWDRSAGFEVEFAEAALTSISADAALAGGNALLIETSAGWELLTFQRADYVWGRRYALSQLLRGLQGTEPVGASVGARCVVVDDAVVRASLARDEIGLPLVWRAAGAGEDQVFTFENRQAEPWSVVHLRAADGQLSWFRRHPDNSDSWVLPDTGTAGTFEVDWTFGDGSNAETVVSETVVAIPAGAMAASVAEVDGSGRRGVSVSIVL